MLKAILNGAVNLYIYLNLKDLHVYQVLSFKSLFEQMSFFLLQTFA